MMAIIEYPRALCIADTASDRLRSLTTRFGRLEPTLDDLGAAFKPGPTFDHINVATGSQRAHPPVMTALRVWAHAVALAAILLSAGCRSDKTTGPMSDGGHVTLARGVYEVKVEPSGWSRTRSGDWLVIRSSDNTAVVGFLGIEYSKGGARMLWFKPEALGVSEDDWSARPPGLPEIGDLYGFAELGPDHLHAWIERGRGKLNSRSAALTLMTVSLPEPTEPHLSTAWPGIEKQALVVIAIADDAPPTRRLEAKAVADSIQRTR